MNPAFLPAWSDYVEIFLTAFFLLFLAALLVQVYRYGKLKKRIERCEYVLKELTHMLHSDRGDFHSEVLKREMEKPWWEV